MKTQLSILSVLTIFSLFFFSCEKEADVITDIETGTEVTETVGANHAVAGEYIVVYKEDKSLYGKSEKLKVKYQQTLSKYAIQEGKIKHTYSNAIQGFHITNLSEKQVEILKDDPEIAYIQPNYIKKLNIEVGEPVSELPTTVHNKAAVSDSWLPSGDYLPWGINRVGRADGTGRTCWIIDTGISPHSDLNIDTSRSRSVIGGSWEDQNGHGTHVAGTVAAKYNGSGVIGVAYGATVVSVKVLAADGSGTTETILSGVDYVTANARNGDTWNYSIAYLEPYVDNAVDNAFRNLERVAHGAMAAGNSNDGTQYYSPQRLLTGRSWCVGNMTSTDSPAYGSCYGESVDRWAPGTDVWSTWLNGQYNIITGTSMASPHVAGILLLRGNSTGTDGSISKGGYAAPIATLN
jgi:subtilisin family serine protease